MADGPLIRRWALDAPLDVRWTLIRGHGPGGTPVDVHHYRPGDAGTPLSGSWRGARMASGAAAVRMEVVGTELRAAAWGDGAEEALGQVPRWLGLDDRWPAPLGRQPLPPRLRELERKHRGIRIGTTGRLSDALVPIVLAQRVTNEEAVRGYNLLSRRCSEPAPGPNRRLYLPPEPARLVSLPMHEFRRFGVEASRASTIREVATRAATIDALPADDLHDSYRRLQSIRGLGPWTAAIAVARAFGWADAVPVHDYDLPHAVSWNFTGERRGSDERMLELLEPWRGQRWRIIQLLVAAFAFPPRIAPRYRSRGFNGRHRPPSTGA